MKYIVVITVFILAGCNTTHPVDTAEAHSLPTPYTDESPPWFRSESPDRRIAHATKLLTLFPERPSSCKALGVMAEAYAAKGEMLYLEMIISYIEDVFLEKPGFEEEATLALERLTLLSRKAKEAIGE